ncbi:MAG: 50S ribosomal protein L13 [Candidatus Micrarchaeota archaeon]|nr:50S ribosomal protein L13 [Candidatus Micrarchaeota archaeon]
MVTIDASGAIVGRLCARVAKLLLANQQVEIINADKAVMAGSLSAAKENYLSRRGQKNKRTPEDSPVWPRVPHLLLRRIVRGMLPRKSRRGRDAYHRLKVVVGAPEGAKAQKIPEAAADKKRVTFTLEELCDELGKHIRKD